MQARTVARLALSLAFLALAFILVWKLGLPTPTPHVATDVGQPPQVPPGAILVNVNMIGFDPDSIPATAGRPLKLAFYRPVPSNCTREVVFPSLGIRKELPPGETVIVEITPQKSGRLAFECGMKMLKGQVVVQ